MTVKLLLVAGVNDPSVADNVKEPLFVGTRFEKVATPFTAAAVKVEAPLKTPPPLIAIVTLEVFPGTTSPLLSTTWTVTAGEIADPAVEVPGC